MNGKGSWRRAVRARGAIGRAALGLTLLGVALQAVPAARATGTCTTPPPVFPVDQLVPGMTGTGYTVIAGRTITSFDVEILGVLRDGIYPGVDFILAQITGPRSFLDKTGGIVAGMSGSPVYIHNKLVGSTSYGFFASSDSQTLMGITPAEGMVQLFDYPGGTGTAPSSAKTVRLPDSFRTAAAKETSGTETTIPATAQQLLVPLAVGGLTGKHFGRFSRLVGKANFPLLPYRSGSAPAPASTPSSTPLQPGDGFSAALSYGDFTLAGIGTTTATCGNLALAFGHPFLFSGPTSLGVNGADVLAIVKLDLFGGYKLANVGPDLHGTMDQDRLLGVREIDGDIPALTPVTAAILNPDIPKARTGETDVVTHLPQGFFLDLPFVAAFSELFEQDVAFDRIGDGSSSLQWKIEGIDPDGNPFTLTRDDKFFSPYDISFESIFELYGILETIQNNKFGNISFTHVSETGDITQDQLTSTITKVLSASSLQPALMSRRRLLVRPGDTIRLRVFLLRQGTTTPRKVDLVLDVPSRISGGSGELSVGAGQPQCTGEFFFGQTSCGAKTFDGLLAKIANGDHHYDLVGTLSLFAGTKSGGHRVRREAVSTQPDVVLGNKSIGVEVMP